MLVVEFYMDHIPALFVACAFPSISRVSFSRHSSMLRRSPTRLEHKLDDLQEYEAMRREQEAQKEPQQQTNTTQTETWGPGSSKQSTQAAFQERIGYVPQPRTTK